MSGPIFPISLNKSDFCYNPLTCNTKSGHLVVWAYGVDRPSQLFARAYNNRETTQTAVKICNLAENDHLLFLRRYTNELYVLAIETFEGTRVYFLDEDATVYDYILYESKDVLLYCYCTETCTVLFTYNHKYNTMTVGTVDSGTWNNYTTLATYTDVYGMPQVFMQGNNYTAGWVTKDDCLKVANSNITASDANITTLDSYDVEYLLATQIDKDVIVYGGYCDYNNTLRLDFFTLKDGKHINSRYWASKEYKNMHLNMISLNRGFMLLADGPDELQVYGQRFTHLGTWLYPMRELVSTKEPTWSPDMARSHNNTMLVYIRDYDDHSEVWGKWMDIGEIPELNNLCLE